jgi:hypothetical protein
MSHKLELKSFLAFTKGLEGERLITKARRKNFKVNVLENALEFIPESSGVARREMFTNVTKILEHYNKHYSLKPTEYHDITHNSVYVITIIQKYLNA